jgi:DNA-binding NtrC family response regulator
VRELENAIRAAAALADGPVLGEEDLRSRLGTASPAAAPPAPGAAGNGTLRPLDEVLRDMILAHGGRMSDLELARRLGISRKSLWEKRKKLGLL